MDPPLPSTSNRPVQIIRKSSRVINRKLPYGSDFIYSGFSPPKQEEEEEVSKKEQADYIRPEQLKLPPKGKRALWARELLPVQKAKTNLPYMFPSIKYLQQPGNLRLPIKRDKTQNLNVFSNYQSGQPSESKPSITSSVKTVLPQGNRQLVGTIQKFVPGFRTPIVKRVFLKPDTSFQRIPVKDNGGRKFILKRRNRQEEVHLKKLMLPNPLSKSSKQILPREKVISTCELNGQRVYVRPKLNGPTSIAIHKHLHPPNPSIVSGKKPNTSDIAVIPNKEKVLLDFTEDEYKGVVGVPSARAYDHDKMSILNPRLARRLNAIMVNLKCVAAIEAGVVPRRIDRFMPYKIMPLNSCSSPKKIKKKFNDDEIPTRVSGPVTVDKSGLNTSNSNLGTLLNLECGSTNMINVMFNGKNADIPEIIYCHLCGCEMRICMRKSKYRGEVREYPAYRCLKKGCQTFRAIRKVIDLESFPKAPIIPDKIFPSIQTTVHNTVSKDVLENKETNKTDATSKLLEVAVKVEGDDEEEDVEWTDIPVFQDLMVENSPASSIKYSDDAESGAETSEEPEEMSSDSWGGMVIGERKPERDFFPKNFHNTSTPKNMEKLPLLCTEEKINGEFGFLVEEQTCE